MDFPGATSAAGSGRGYSTRRKRIRSRR